MPCWWYQDYAIQIQDLFYLNNRYRYKKVLPGLHSFCSEGIVQWYNALQSMFLLMHSYYSAWEDRWMGCEGHDFASTVNTLDRYICRWKYIPSDQPRTQAIIYGSCEVCWGKTSGYENAQWLHDRHYKTQFRLFWMFSGKMQWMFTEKQWRRGKNMKNFSKQTPCRLEFC
jgi:hypothetical protein